MFRLAFAENKAVAKRVGICLSDISGQVIKQNSRHVAQALLQLSLCQAQLGKEKLEQCQRR